MVTIGCLLIIQLPVSVNSNRMKLLFRSAKQYILVTVMLAIGLSAFAQASDSSDSILFRKLYNEALKNGETDMNLRYLTSRISGSLQAQQTVEWSKKVLAQYKPDSVYLQPVTVPHWVRGTRELSYYTVKGHRVIMDVSALGGSIGTNGLLTAGVVEVKSWAELVEWTGQEPVDKRFNKI